ncbi:hypothetical protein FQN54_007639 [Arachnomyces sp. PD_36]|nr:hypothetical protein FQN54_007639 [Arachnomyces sp. PD_36]
MACPISLTKFVGTISLGLLTGVSYTTSAISVPTLQSLPTSSTASRALRDLQRHVRRNILTLSALTNVSFLTCYALSSPRRKHPYLVWTAALAALGGAGVEWWYNGGSSSLLCFIPGCAAWRGRSVESSKSDGSESDEKDEEWVVQGKASESGTIVDEDVNGEIVRAEMDRECRIQRVRTWILGIGFSMSVVGIWGDGA